MQRNKQGATMGVKQAIASIQKNFFSRTEIDINSSDGHDKPFCAKAITIIDNFKNALADTDNR